MFKLERLEEIKWELDHYIEHPNALIRSTILKDQQYEIIKLEEITERTFVYKALDLLSGDFVSIKEFFPAEALGITEQLYFTRNFDTNAVELKDYTSIKNKQYKDLVDNFIEEAKYLEKISYGDPILRIVDSFEDLNTAYLVTNYNKWPTLQNLLDHKYVFNIEEMDFIAKQLLDVVLRFHRRSIVHRNVSPKNIYIKPNEVIVDSLGTCDFLQDIKIYDADAYQNKYFAPEVMMHNGVIGTWSDVYAVGKVLIDIICKMTESGDYFKGLSQIQDEKRRNTYAEVIKSAIKFNYEERLQNAMNMKRSLYDTHEQAKSFKTPRGMIAMISLISFVSCMMVIWQYQTGTIVSNDDFAIIIEEEDTPLGVPTDKKNVRFITLNKHVFEADAVQKVLWFRSGRSEMVAINVLSVDEKILFTDFLDTEEMSYKFDTLDLAPGFYKFQLMYKIDDVKYSESIEIEIKE